MRIDLRDYAEWLWVGDNTQGGLFREQERYVKFILSGGMAP